MIKKLLLGLTLTSGLMMANTNQTDDLLSLATTGKVAGTALEMNKTDMEKADGGWYYSSNRFSYKKSYLKTLKFRINGYHQNRMNKIASYIKPKSYTPTPISSPRVQEVKKTYHLGIGKSVYMTPTAFKAYLAKHY